MEGPALEFLKPFQLPPESTAELKLLAMLDAFPAFVTAANRFTDACCQNLVKIIRSSSVSSAIRQTPTPDLAKRIRETAFGPLDEILSHVAAAAKRIEAINESLQKASDQSARADALRAIGADELASASDSGALASSGSPLSADQESARLYKAKHAAFGKMIEYVKAIQSMPEAAMSYSAGKCFGAEVNYEFEKEELAEFLQQVQPRITVAVLAFERAARVEKTQLEEQKARVAATKEEQVYFDALQVALEEKLEQQARSQRQFRKWVIVALFGLGLITVAGLVLFALYAGFLSGKKQ